MLLEQSFLEQLMRQSKIYKEMLILTRKLKQ